MMLYDDAEMQEIPYWSGYSKARLLLHTITSSKYFDLAIAGVIGINVITMAMEYYMMPKVWIIANVVDGNLELGLMGIIRITF